MATRQQLEARVSKDAKDRFDEILEAHKFDDDSDVVGEWQTRSDVLREIITEWMQEHEDVLDDDVVTPVTWRVDPHFKTTEEAARMLD